jgi:hypothetical protein
MTLEMERDFDGQRMTIRPIGRIEAERLLELKAEMKEGGPKEELDWTISDWDTPMLFFGQRGYV